MTTRRLLAALVCLAGVAALGTLGCGLTEPLRETTSFFRKSLTTGGTDREHWADEQADPWIEEAGVEARGDRPREKDPDRWFKNWFQSEKARSIERNMGID